MTTLFNTTFEDGHLYQKPITTGFHAVYIDGGTIEVNDASKYAGNYGCAISPVQYYKACGIQYGGSLAKLRQRFYIDPNSLTMTDTRSFVISRNYHDDASRVIFAINLRYAAPNYQINFGMSDNTEAITTNSGNTTLPDQWNYIESYWQAGSPGSLSVWLNGSFLSTLTATNNNCRIKYPSLGVAHWSSYAVSGTFYIDNWQGNDDGTEIGA